MYGCRAIFAGMLLLLAATSRSVGVEAAPVAVEILPEVTIPGRRVLVADIARLTGGTANIRRRMASLDLGMMSSSPTTIPRTQVFYRLLLAGFSPDTFRLGGAESTLVRPWRDRLSQETIAEAARQHLLNRIPWSRKEVVVRLMQPVYFHVPVPPKQIVTLQAELAPDSNLVGVVRVDVSVYVDGKPQPPIPVVFNVRLYQRVAVAVARIDPGQRIDANKVYVDRRLTEEGRETLADPDAVIGRRAKRTIRPGHVITVADLSAPSDDAPIAVKRMDLVKAIARVGYLQVSTLATALQDGRVGDIIRVRNNGSKKIVSARVVDRGLVEVDY
ncbi:MAG: hypothetical protein KatS3mg105_4854 [Gemmatales bacterium]|nr:MAG: hypothetical protein KatS3mg105_4854 [Gemmatales bacterium]